MSDKFFFKGRKSPKPKHQSVGYKTKRVTKPGTSDSPLTLVVPSEERQAEVEAILSQHELVANIEVNAEVEENISELDCMLNTPQTTRFEKKPNRNDPCSCGSGNKYKKCCG